MTQPKWPPRAGRRGCEWTMTTMRGLSCSRWTTPVIACGDFGGRRFGCGRNMCWCVLNNYLYYEMLIIFSRFAPISRRLTTRKRMSSRFGGARGSERRRRRRLYFLTSLADLSNSGSQFRRLSLDGRRWRVRQFCLTIFSIPYLFSSRLTAVGAFLYSELTK